MGEGSLAFALREIRHRLSVPVERAGAVQKLELDAVGIVEEDRVVPGGVVVLTGPRLNLGAAIMQPPSTLVHDLTREDVEAEMVNADRVAVKRNGVCVGLFLAKSECRNSRPLDREVPHGLALLAADLTEAGPADRPQKLTVEGQAALDRADDEIDVAELGFGDWGRLSATKGPESAISVAIPAAQGRAPA